MRKNIVALLLLTISAQQVAKAGQVVLTSDPPGATITAVGKQLGIAPLTIDLPNGAVEVTSHFGCLEPVAQTVNAEDGQVSAYNFNHSYGTLIIRSDSAAANIAIDGVACGHGSALVFVAPGPHKILAKTNDAGERTQDVNVMDGHAPALIFISAKVSHNRLKTTQIQSRVDSRQILLPRRNQVARVRCRS